MNTRKKEIPRGMRNNNPLNIRIGNTWLGERSPADCDDPQFEQFLSLSYGLRAAFCILRRYIKHYHRNTITQIIASWAPAKENDTRKYVAFVCEKMKCSADRKILYDDKPTMCALVQAMAQMECGVVIPPADIEKGYDMA